MLRGKRVVLTGASSGLGAALALALAGAGADVALLARRRQRLEEVAAACRARGVRALAIAGDVVRQRDCQRLVDEAAAAWGGVDYAVASAGISMWAPFEQVEEVEVFRRLMEVNYMGVVHCAHCALPHLRQSGGMLVAISSIQGKVPVPLHSGYVAAKHAVQGFCDALRLELRGTGVDVLTVLPHWLRGTGLRHSALGGDGRPLGESARRHSSESIAVEEASARIVRAMQARRRQLVMPWKLELLAAVYALKPEWAEAVVRRAVARQEGGGRSAASSDAADGAGGRP